VARFEQSYGTSALSTQPVMGLRVSPLARMIVVPPQLFCCARARPITDRSNVRRANQFEPCLRLSSLHKFGMSPSRRLARRGLPLLKERVLNFIMDAQQPFFRARGAIAEMCGLYLKLSCPFFRGSKLR